MFKDYYEFAADYRAKCARERRAAEELEELKEQVSKPRATTKAATAEGVCKSNGAGLVYKTRDDARVADDDNSGASVARTSSKQSWWQWTDKRIEQHLEAFGEEVAKKFGEAMAEWVGGKVDPLKRELELTRRELDVVRMEVNVKALQEEVRTARAEIPKFDAEQKQLRAEQARLERELAKVKDRVGKVRVEQSITAYGLAQLEKQARASSAASIEMEFESQSTHFQMKASHPEAAKALKEFAGKIINGEADGTIWLPGSAGTA